MNSQTAFSESGNSPPWGGRSPLFMPYLECLAPAVAMAYKAARRALIEKAGAGRKSQKKTFRRERFRRDRLGVTLNRCCWRGEPRPKGFRRVTLHARYPSKEFIYHLVEDFGYDGRAANAAMGCSWDKIVEYARLAVAHGQTLDNFRGVRSSQRQASTAAGKDDSGNSGSGWKSLPGANNYPATRRTKSRPVFPRKAVVAVLRKSRYSDKMTIGVFEVVYHGRSPKKVAEERGIPYGTLKVFASRTRAAAREICTSENISG